MQRLQRYLSKGRDVSFELDDDFEQLKTDLLESMSVHTREPYLTQGIKDLRECDTYVDLATWYSGYVGFAPPNLGDWMLKSSYVSYDDEGGHDYWKFGPGTITGARYPTFYRECDLLRAKHKFNLDDGDIDILRI